MRNASLRQGPQRVRVQLESCGCERVLTGEARVKHGAVVGAERDGMSGGAQLAKVVRPALEAQRRVRHGRVSSHVRGRGAPVGWHALGKDVGRETQLNRDAAAQQCGKQVLVRRRRHRMAQPLGRKGQHCAHLHRARRRRVSRSQEGIE